MKYVKYVSNSHKTNVTGNCAFDAGNVSLTLKSYFCCIIFAFKNKSLEQSFAFGEQKQSHCEQQF